MPVLNVPVTENTLRQIRRIEALRGETPQQLDRVTGAGLTTLGNLLYFLQEHGHKGRIQIVVRDEGRRHYSEHRDLSEFIPFEDLS